MLAEIGIEAEVVAGIEAEEAVAQKFAEMAHPKLVEKSVVAASRGLAVEALAVELPDVPRQFGHYDICFVAL